LCLAGGVAQAVRVPSSSIQTPVLPKQKPEKAKSTIVSYFNLQHSSFLLEQKRST
jgi:hypothetical protein